MQIPLVHSIYLDCVMNQIDYKCMNKDFEQKTK